MAILLVARRHRRNELLRAFDVDLIVERSVSGFLFDERFLSTLDAQQSTTPSVSK
jgi:hypothetical protein